MTSTRLNWPHVRSILDRTVGVRCATPLSVCAPGLRYGTLPAKRDTADLRSRLDCFVARCLTHIERHQYNEESKSDWLSHIAEQVESLADFEPDQLVAKRNGLSQKMKQVHLTKDLFDEALAHATISFERSLQLTPRPNQYLAARAMLEGHFVEMATGEGKTLSVALVAGALAISGTPVHVLTANEYLAERDALSLEDYYQSLGLQVAYINSGQEGVKRRQSYRADVVYVTAKQVAFDWLGDVIETGSQSNSLVSRLSSVTQAATESVHEPILRGLCLAIVDEADSLLVDEATVPLILSTNVRTDSDEKVEAIVALGLAEQLREDIDYSVLPTTRQVRLSGSGRDELEKLSKSISHVWSSSRYREERVVQALSAMHLFMLDRDYIVRDGVLHLMDIHTGRSLSDRRLPNGLHMMVELKEKCTPTLRQEPLASVSFQEYFKRYFGMAGTSGTLREVGAEIHTVYDRFVVPIPSDRPSLRIDTPTRVFLDRSTQLQKMLDEVRRRNESGQPVLVCTRSVEQSLGVSGILMSHGLKHQVLNAYQDADEAAIVAMAGQAGCVTVATNMAGRGTDIRLEEAVVESGGLHVLSLAFNDARRLDRQLAGRAARQGDPGSYQQLISLDDAYVVDATSSLFRLLVRICIARDWHGCAAKLLRSAQWRTERKHRKERMSMYRSRENRERQIAFGGKPEHVS